MILYHGTSEQNLPYILEHGIQPRSKHGTSNWDHSITSNPDAVYLTNSYALYFAYSAVQLEEGTKDRLVVLEIDTDKLKKNRLCADEDVIAQANFNNKHPNLPKEMDTLYKATEYYRGRMQNYDHEVSLDLMGTCAFLGTIPVDAITRVAFMSIDKYIEMIFRGHDPQISIANFAFMSDEYRKVMKWLFDPTSVDVEEKEVFPGVLRKPIPVPDDRQDIQVRSMKELLYKHLKKKRKK